MTPVAILIGGIAGGWMRVTNSAAIVRIRKYIMIRLPSTASTLLYQACTLKRRPACIQNWSLVMAVRGISRMKEYVTWNYKRVVLWHL